MSMQVQPQAYIECQHNVMSSSACVLLECLNVTVGHRLCACCIGTNTTV